jgi:quinol-cytochrome oxidoreductase complex cytochrome b subunit
MLINRSITFLAAIPIVVFVPFIIGSNGRHFTEGKFSLIFIAFAAVFMVINDIIGEAMAKIEKIWLSQLFPYVPFLLNFADTICYFRTMEQGDCISPY